MDIQLHRFVCRALPKEICESIGINQDDMRFRESTAVDLDDLTIKVIEKLAAALKPLVYEKGLKVKEANQPYKDVTTWIRILKKGTEKEILIKDAKTFTSILKAALSKMQGHRIFVKSRSDDEWLSYYVGSVEYEPIKHHRGGGVTPAHTVMKLYHYVLGKLRETSINIWESSFYGKNVYDGLLANNIVVEDEDLRNEYLEEKKLFMETFEKIGRQYLAEGSATDDVDGNDDTNDEEDSWWRGYNEHTIFLSKDGEPAHVVIDVFNEKDSVKTKSKSDDEDDDIDWSFWGDMNEKGEANDGPEYEDEEERDDDVKRRKKKNAADRTEVVKIGEVPIHPYVVCFDLRRQMRLKIHVNQLTKYSYDTTLGESLELPKNQKDLIDALLSAKSGFKDVIKGKGGGAIILGVGGPGLGKTLTAEVYAEVAKRPLYSVQCSQLGTEPEELEKNLLKTFARAIRWRAILLLDEADVYIHKRGNDLKQNAVVGVFLRTLEYYRGVMFMTSNRKALIDDAIASRCVALIEYKIPDRDGQLRLWEKISKKAEIELSAKDIAKIVDKYPSLSGRDVKNLLKLALMVSSSKDEKITLATIDAVKQFKPTADLKED